MQLLFKLGIFSFLLIFLSPTLDGQINIDSSYSLEELLQFREEASKSFNKRNLAAAYYLIAEYKFHNFDEDGTAMKDYINARQYFELLEDSTMISKIDRSIGLLNLQSGLLQEAEDQMKKSLAYFERIDDLKMVTHINYDISQVYHQKGDIEAELAYLNRAVELNHELQDSLLLLKFYFNKIGIYEKLNEIDSALALSFNAIKLSKKIDDDLSMSKSLFYLSHLNKIQTDYDKALNYALKSETFAPMKKFSVHRLKLYKLISDCYERVDDYKGAYNYSQKYAALNDSILNQNRIESMNNYAMKFKTNEQETSLKYLEIDKKLIEQRNKQQRNAMYILTAGLLLLLALLYYIINFYRQRINAEEIINSQKQEISQQKIRELEDNIKISSMQSMLEGQEIERERISKDLHDSLGGLLSTIKLQFDSVTTKVKDLGEVKEYKSANKMLDSAVEEVRSISQNLQPGSLMKLGLIPALKDLFNRFDEEIYPEIDFQYYSIPDDIPNMVALSIYRIIQELLHNAIKHAHASEILIQINREKDELVIQFEDDGEGYDQQNMKRKGMGLDNIRSRVNYLKGSISTDSAKGKGTSTLIHFKYKLN